MDSDPKNEEERALVRQGRTMKPASITSLIVVCFVGVVLAGCGLSVFAEPKTYPIIEDRVGRAGSQPLGTLGTTAERRIVIARIAPEDARRGLFCAEPSPDAAESVASKLALALEATVKTAEVDGAGRFDLTKQLSTAIQSLFHRSQGVQLYRDGMYAICQAYLNEAISAAEYVKQMNDLRTTTEKLITLELEKTQGVIGGPPAASFVVQFGEEPLPTRLTAARSDRVRSMKLVSDFERAKRSGEVGQAKIVLVDVHDVVVTRNIELSDSTQRTLNDDEIRTLLDRLRPLAKDDASRKSLVLPKDLKGKTQPEFEALFF